MLETLVKETQDANIRRIGGTVRFSDEDRELDTERTSLYQRPDKNI